MRSGMNLISKKLLQYQTQEKFLLFFRLFLVIITTISKKIITWCLKIWFDETTQHLLLCYFFKLLCWIFKDINLKDTSIIYNKRQMNSSLLLESNYMSLFFNWILLNWFLLSLIAILFIYIVYVFFFKTILHHQLKKNTQYYINQKIYIY